MKNIVVLISGRGSNLEALLRTAEEERWREQLGAAITAVISNRADAAGLEIARDSGIPTRVVDHTAFTTRDDFDRALADEIDHLRPAVVVLAGFMRVLTPQFVRRYAGRLINIHPSLLPAFPGLRTHERALDAGVRVHGATVHFVSDEVDAGGIIAQAAVLVRPGDDAPTLAARVLAQEHRLLPRSVRLVLEDRVRWDHGRVVTADVAAAELAWWAS
ncbi:MAG TPA: phosphoribosylglycinamide formyltransferase [Burkholderiaceae bacterium]|nr:phosphoribosylglycinamide formyltransferase [Burkholderiaceae bacterium]HQR71638.1 phosphoribosylglycinamide formyltransferase [Burkholderiaceae bacterium]